MSSISILKQIMSAYPHPEKLKIKDLVRVSSMIDTLVDKGPELFQVITDFDYTLTKSRLPNGERGGSGPGVMSNSPLMSDEFRRQAKVLYNTYHPVEVNPQMNIEEKIPLMVEWYEKRKEIVIAAKFHKSLIPMMAVDAKVALRDGAKASLSLLNDVNVPVLIYSAGNGDILEEVMRMDGALFPNAHIISNFFKFNDDGMCIGYKNKTLIHVFNKNEHAVEDCSYFVDLINRPNALVLGDSIGDVSMSEGMHNPGTILKIGFLNDEIEENLESFQNNFDVVLLDDQTFDFINILLKFLLKLRS